MRNLLVGLFWLWLIVAVGIYAYRIWRRISRGPSKTSSEDESGDTAASELAGPRTVAPLPPIPPLPTPEREAPALRDEPHAATARSGLFAAAPKASDHESEAATTRGAPTSDARPTVADALTGIAMPCDLTPLVTTTRFVDPYRVAFTTDSAPAARVGAEIGDELERLGFALTSTAANQLVAAKDDARVTVTIHTDPTTVMLAEEPAYPNARPGSIVVEFQT